MFTKLLAEADEMLIRTLKALEEGSAALERALDLLEKMDPDSPLLKGRCPDSVGEREMKG